MPVIWTAPSKILAQIGSRLFPFQRGLVHNYPASNIWSLYIFVVRIYLAIPVLYSRYVNKVKTKLLTFEATDHSFYKKVSMIFTMVFMFPVIYKMILNMNSKNFCKYLAIVSLVSYNFGYHVHEKAILMTYIPLLLAVDS
jgi:alpha-1,3-glucosyltransferase